MVATLKRDEDPKILITWKASHVQFSATRVISVARRQMQSLSSGLMKRRLLGNDRWSEILPRKARILSRVLDEQKSRIFFSNFESLFIILTFSRIDLERLLSKEKRLVKDMKKTLALK